MNDRLGSRPSTFIKSIKCLAAVEIRSYEIFEKSEKFSFVEVFHKPFNFYDGVNRVDVNVFRYSEFLNLDFPRSVLGLVSEI